MAGNKMSTKTKGKEDKGKGNVKPMSQSGEDTEEPDFSLLRKPILTSVTGFGQARKIFDLATEELKDLLSNECDLLYECKVCRNIFRSLANFLSHKRVYCKEKFNSSLHGHFIQATSTISELMKIKHLEQGYQESIGGEVQETCEDDERIPLTKDLTAIVEKISKYRAVSNSDDPQLMLQKIPSSSVAVFQNVEGNESQNDNMRAQMKELDNMLCRDLAVLQSDGKFKIKSSLGAESDNVIQISDDDDHDGAGSGLKCKICFMQFSTQKTLKFHMKYKHVESRLVYPCPDCLEIFSTSWSVYRHLFKVHRKSAAQIRRLRESIQAKAFKMNNPPAFYEKRKNNMKSAQMQKITEEERLDQENQAWMDNMECDGELPRCGGCGRTFERRAALAAHTHTCPPRALARRTAAAAAASSSAANTLTKKIEIQIRKDYNKGPPAALTIPLKTTDANENKLSKEESAPAKLEEDARASEEEEEDGDGAAEGEEDVAMDVSEEDRKSSDAAESPEKPAEPEPTLQGHRTLLRLPFAHQTEKSNFVAFKQRIRPEVDITKLLCKRCDARCSDLRDLYDHVAEHLKWVRYACKLCNYRHYLFEKLPEHLKVVHKLKGDKDFYFSTVKAITGAEALQLCENAPNDVNDTSPDSRRPSRCSSDSSRLSDDSSSSSTRMEAGSRKRKLYQSKNNSKRRKELPMKVVAAEESKDNELNPDKEIRNLGENDSSTSRTFEENSSDMDDIDEKIAKRSINKSNEDTSSVASRRPVRRKAKPKNEDFEYDLSNLLKMEAQGYRDSLSLANQSKSNQTKRKVQQDNNQNNYDIANKDNCGALLTLSKKAVENSAAHMKTSFSTYCVQKELRAQNIFVRPLLPKSLSRGDKISPKKESNEDPKESSSPTKETKINKNPSEEPIKSTDEIKAPIKELTDSTASSTDKNCSSGTTSEAIKSSISIPSVVPIKFRRQSLEVIKNPIINKNISEFTKAGMKTKILVIKPINRNKDGKLKFQTIKLKDTNKGSSNEDKSSDQVVVVKVPKVDRTIVRPVTDVCNSKSEKTPPTDQQNDNTDNSVPNEGTPDDETEKLVSKETNNDPICKKVPSNEGNGSDSECISQDTSNINGESVNNDNKEDILSEYETLEHVNTTV